MADQIVIDRRPEGPEDSAKRRQIVEGARDMFLARGFDAASMGDIAKAAGVSKGTLYVYFKNKEELFARHRAGGMLPPMPKASSDSTRTIRRSGAPLPASAPTTSISCASRKRPLRCAS